jgi:hypothetical protein
MSVISNSPWRWDQCRRLIVTLRPLALHAVIACSLLTGGASAEIASQGTTNITANYGVYWAGLRFGDVRLVIKVRDSQYKMAAKGRFSVMGGLIYEWRGDTTSAGKLRKSGPPCSMNMPRYRKQQASRIPASTIPPQQ